jgi:hypothetical protein
MLRQILFSLLGAGIGGVIMYFVSYHLTLRVLTRRPPHAVKGKE